MKQPNQVDDAFGDKPAPQEEASFGDILTQFEQEQHEHAAHDAPGKPCRVPSLLFTTTV